MSEYDAANERHIAIQRRASKALEDSHNTFITGIMDTVDGRAYINDLLTYCHVFGQPFSTDALSTAFGCGQLDVGQIILRRIHALCPDLYVLMMREANARTATDDARRSRSDKDANGRDTIPAYVHPAFGDAPRPDSPADADSEYNPTDGLDEGEV